MICISNISLPVFTGKKFPWGIKKKLSHDFENSFWNRVLSNLLNPIYFLLHSTDLNVLSARRCSTGPEISAPTCKPFIRCDLKSLSSKTTSSPSQKKSFWKLPPPETNKLKYPESSLPDPERNILKYTRLAKLTLSRCPPT